MIFFRGIFKVCNCASGHFELRRGHFGLILLVCDLVELCGNKNKKIILIGCDRAAELI